MPIDFIAEETEAPKIDFVPDAEEPQPEPPAAPRPPVPERPSQQRPPSFEPGELLPQQRLPERTPEQKAFMETPLVDLPDITPWQAKAATALGIPGVESGIRAFTKPVVELAEAATSPEGLAMLPALVAAPMIAGPALAVPMLPEIPHGVQQTVEAAKVGDVPGAIESGVRTALTTGMTAAGLAAPALAFMPKTRAALAETLDMPAPPEIPPSIPQAAPVGPVPPKFATVEQAQRRAAIKAARPTVPETPPEPARGLTVIKEIRQAGANTKEKVQELYPHLTREEAATLRDQAFPRDRTPDNLSQAEAERVFDLQRLDEEANRQIEGEPSAIPQREAEALPVQERASVSPQVGEEIRQQAAAKEAPETIAERLVPWGEKALMDPAKARQISEHAYFEQGQVFAALSDAYGVRRAMRMTNGEEPYPSLENFREHHDAFLVREGEKLRGSLLSVAARLGKTTEIPPASSFPTGRAFHDAMLKASSDVQKSGAAMEASFVKHDKPPSPTKPAAESEVPSTPQETPAPPAQVEAGGAASKKTKTPKTKEPWEMTLQEYREREALGFESLSTMPEGKDIVGNPVKKAGEHAQWQAEQKRMAEETRSGRNTTVDAMHRAHVAKAIERGRKVPKAVMEEYAAKEPPPVIEGMGGAVPSEFAPTMRTSTGIKNAAVDKARKDRGLDPIMKPATQAEEMVWSRTMARIDRESGWQDALIEELKTKPRNLSPDEIIALDHRYVDLQNEYAKSTRLGEEAYRDKRMEDVAIAQEQTAMWESKLIELEQIAQSTGAEWGRSGHMRQRLLKEDFTLEAMERKMRAAKGFKPLTEAERASIQKQFAELEAKNKRLEAIGVEKDQLLAEAQMARTMAEMQAAAAKEGSKIPEQIQRIVTRVGEILDSRADAARKRLAGKVFSLSPDVLKDLAEIGASNIFHIGMDLTKWSAKMVQDLGERIQPHLRSVWEASLKVYDATIDLAAGKQETPVKKQVKTIIRDNDTPEGRVAKLEQKIADRVEKGDGAIEPFVQRLARELVEGGITDRATLIDRVHDILSGIIPDWTKRQTMDAISGYGRVKLLRKDDVSLRLRDLKGQMQQLAKLEDMAAGQAPLRTGIERRTPSDIEKELIKQVNEAKKKGGYETTDPERQLRTALDEVKSRMQTEIKELERRLKEKDFTKRTPREIKLDKEANALELQREELKQAYAQELLQKKLAEQSTPRRLYRGAQEIANVWRAIKTSFDFSAVLNQGKFIVLTRPTIAARAIPGMLRAFMSKEAAFASDKAILKRDNYPLYQQAKLYLSEHGAPLNRMEEVYMSRWAEKIPIVAGSARAYTTFLNRIRADAFDAMVETLGRNGTVTPAEASVLANYINVATGRGGIGLGERVGTGLNTWLFAPRFVASRFQMALGQPLYHGILTQKKGFLKETARARKLVAMEYAKLLGAYSVFYGLAHAAGFKIGLDPKSTDFGKIIIGDTRIDPLAGVSQAWVLMHRTATRKKTTLKGKVQPLTGKIPYGQDDLTDVWKQFGRSKLAPAPATAVDLLTGQDVTGQPIPKDALGLIGQYVGPISLQDVTANMRTMGIPLGVAATIANIFGERIKTYEDRKR